MDLVLKITSNCQDDSYYGTKATSTYNTP